MHVITQSCVLFLWMITLTFVKSRECTLGDFLESPLYDEHFNTSNLHAVYHAGQQVTVDCKPGYNGSVKLTCVEGRWSARGRRCEPQQCPAIHVDTNVLVTGDQDEAIYGSVVRFSCKSNNQILDGPMVIYCDENGDWSEASPKCKEVQCSNRPQPHVSRWYPSWRSVLDTTVRYICERGYRSPDGRNVATCTRTGWRPDPLCEAVKCRLSQAKLEGTTYDPAYRNVFSPGDTLRVICGQKYWISDPEYTSVVTTCKEDGEWTIRPVCQEVQCSNQPQPQQHVSRWTPWDWRSVLGTTVSYTCKRGYRSPDGRNVATCTRKGWSPDPLCEESI